MDSSALRIPLKEDSSYKYQLKAHISNNGLTRDAWAKHKDEIPDVPYSNHNIGTSWNSKFKLTEHKEVYFKITTKIAKDECFYS